MTAVTTFSRYVGIDYSGAKTPTKSLKGLRVYMATGDEVPAEVLPPPSPRKYWTRRGLAEWLVTTLREPGSTIVGIDHAFSFPRAYFDRYPSLWRGRYPPADRTSDQHDAYTACRWLQETDRRRELHRYLSPALSDEERSVAAFEGWILGIA